MNTALRDERPAFMSIAAVRIKERRKLLHLTQKELAAAAGVSPELVGLVEAGKITVQLDGLEKILNALGFTLSLADRT